METAATDCARAEDRFGQESEWSETVTVTLDIRPPTVTMTALPAYTSADQLALSWPGVDPMAGSSLGSGIADYDVQRRFESGTWTDWLMDTYASGAMYQIGAAGEGFYQFRARARDGVGNQGVYTETAMVQTVVDWHDPVVTATLTTTNTHVYIDGNVVYYGPKDGAFTFAITATEPLPASGQPAGLDEILFPTTVSAGEVYTQSGALTATVPHTYSFDAATNVSGSYAITVTDRAGNETTVPFSVYADHISPTVTITVPERPTTTNIPVQWSAQEEGSGLRGYDVEVKVDDGGWARVLTYTQNTTTYPAAMGHTYAFRVQATDNVSNTSAWVEGVARTVVVKKYYHVAGQRIAMRSSNVLYWLHGDHLGSTSLTTDISGTVVAEQKYLPYGEVRWVTGTLATDFTYTGQRGETFGLYDYHARFYSGKLGRFISPDTMVPDPTNFMEFSRYGYCLGNPLRYTDPSGYLSEDEIMRYLGVSTWDDVLALFGEGQALAGRWGWIETLRQAELGDEIAFYDDAQDTWPPSGSARLRGKLMDQDGRLYIQSGDDLFSANDAAWQGSIYYINRSLGRNDPSVPYFGPLYADQMYMHLKFDTSGVDKLDAALDLVGLATFWIPHPAPQAIGNAADVIAFYRSAYRFAVARRDGSSSREVINAGLDCIVDMGGFLPWWYGAAFDVISLGRNFGQGVEIYYSP